MVDAFVVWTLSLPSPLRVKVAPVKSLHFQERIVMSSNRYTEIEFIDAVAKSASIRQVLLSIGLAPLGGNYRTVKDLVKKLNLDTSHWTGQCWNKGQTFSPRRPIEDYLSNEQPIGSSKLKERLVKDGIFEWICSNTSCQITTWNGKKAPLELDHIDGNSHNNSLENLRLLCPNCHAQTSTYRGKNISSQA